MNDEFKPYIDQLRASNLRPTKQRLLISKVLFDRPNTFHFTIEKLKQIVDVPIIVSSTSTPKIQEVHRVISHIICKIVEERLERK